MGATTTDRFLTLPDVAALARVQRPVVSMWISRSSATATPFPAAVVGEGSRHLFALDAVVDWLVTTHHGNNPHVREEAALFATLDARSGTSAQSQLTGLTTMLAIQSLAEPSRRSTAAELQDLADDLDPFDACLYREVVALGDAAPDVAAAAAGMASAAFTPADAFTSLMANRHRLGLQAHAGTALDARVIQLVARVTAELMRRSGQQLPALVAPEGSDDLVVGAATTLGDDEPSVLLVPPTASDTDRLVRRRLLTLGWPVRELAIEDGHPNLPDGCVVLAQYPSPGRPDLSDLDVIGRVDEIALAMHPSDTAVLIGPASALVNRARTAELAGRRAAVLRTGKVRAVLRLPAGLWLSRSRQALAVWVLGPAHPDVAADDRWVTVADLTGSSLDQAAQQDVTSDVLAALGSRRDVYAHAFRFARPVPARDLLAARGDLVGAPRGALRAARRSPVETALAVTELMARAVESTPTVQPQFSVEHHDPTAPRTATLGELVARKAVRVLPGNRIEASALVTDGSVPVLGPDELLGDLPRGRRTVDRLAFAASSSARLTEPGDVVFCSAPRPAAVVDTAGFSAVQAPARILRVLPSGRDAGLVPEALALAMGAAPHGVPWRSWAVRLMPPDQASHLAEMLTAITRTRAELDARLAVLDQLATQLSDAVSTGTLTLNPVAPAVDHHAEQEG